MARDWEPYNYVRGYMRRDARAEMIEGKINSWANTYRLVCYGEPPPPWESEYPINEERWARMRLLAAWEIDNKVSVGYGPGGEKAVFIECSGVVFEENWRRFPSEFLISRLLFRCGDA